jgi:hypothetical protein
MEKFFTILLLSMAFAAVLERLDFIVFGVLVMWIGFIWSVNEMPEPYSSIDREQQTRFVVFLGIMIFLIGASGFYDAFNGNNASRKTPGNYQNSPEYFNEYECTDDCSGHEAGYEWARNNSIIYKSDCGGNSQSFTEGCESWVQNSPSPIWDVKE